MELSDLVTLIIVPKDWYTHAEEALWAVLDENPGVRVLYMLAPPYPAALDVALAAACARHPHTLRVFRKPPLSNPYEMRKAAAEMVQTRYYAVLGNGKARPAHTWEALLLERTARGGQGT